MLSVNYAEFPKYMPFELHYAKCSYPECHFVHCHYAECCGARGGGAHRKKSQITGLAHFCPILFNLNDF
jgi:hypothetical protein